MRLAGRIVELQSAAAEEPANGRRARPVGAGRRPAGFHLGPGGETNEEGRGPACASPAPWHKSEAVCAKPFTWSLRLGLRASPPIRLREQASTRRKRRPRGAGWLVRRALSSPAKLQPAELCLARCLCQEMKGRHHVASLLRLARGEIVTGHNVTVAARGPTLCAPKVRDVKCPGHGLRLNY